ncbi:MAG: thioredoxin domain-containing protein, partial [Ferruginibacter sp.]
SPYLLQHAHNPVDWFPWGEEAFAKARAENKPIFLSIGYSTCHWCHVMERESFENEAVATIMNGQFVNIKIDREERPDLDHIYMDAVQAMTGSGGWPLNVFLTPAAKPFFGGTYFPPVKAFNRSSWTEVLHGISQAWKEKQSEIEGQADNLTDHIQKSGIFTQGANISAGGSLGTLEQFELMFSAIMQTADREWGGFGSAPKFPQTFTIQFLLQYYYFTGNKEALQQALLSIDKMLNGGIYDHVGGGLARYSTDNEWLAPHFEKMLYDNALLINILCDACQLTTDKKYEDAIRKTIAFVTRELSGVEGGFYAALDADSEGEEGKYYVWQKQEIDEILEGDSALFCEFFDVTEGGNWEEKNILRILQPIEDFSKAKRIDQDQFQQFITECLERLSLHRNERTRPALDDKIILGWNALILKAIGKAAVVLQDKSYALTAEKNFNFIQDNFKKDGASQELQHTYKNGEARYPAFLDDYAYLVAACIQLYKLNFDNKYLQIAYDYCDYIIQNFSDDENIFFFFTGKEQHDVIVRKKEIYDGAVPSGNSVMAENLYDLSVIFDKREWQNRAKKMLEILMPSIAKYPGSFGIWAACALRQITGINEIAIVGTNFAMLANDILLKYIPNMVIMATAKEIRKFPLLENKPGGTPALIYLCKNYTCLAPFSHTDLLLHEISNLNKITWERHNILNP